MELTQDQRLALAQRIVDEFTGFVREELQYQVEDMKDQDLLSWEYYVSDEDREDITQLVIDMVAVPVS